MNPLLFFLCTVFVRGRSFFSLHTRPGEFRPGYKTFSGLSIGVMKHFASWTLRVRNIFTVSNKLGVWNICQKNGYETFLQFQIKRGYKTFDKRDISPNILAIIYIYFFHFWFCSSKINSLNSSNQSKLIIFKSPAKISRFRFLWCDGVEDWVRR